MILVDSSVWIDFFRGAETPQADRLDALLDEEIIAVGDLILTEVLQGFDADRDFRRAAELMRAFPVLDLAGSDVAMKAARNFRRLRVLGITTRKTIDTIIATFCIERELPLLYSDRDFDPFVAHLGLMSAMDDRSARRPI
jgi:predicted nucleic acid-binding protein